MPEKIDARDLIPMDIFPSEPFTIDIVYAQAAHPENIFGMSLYHKEARLILHKDLARIVIKTARKLHSDHGWTLILKDGLRPVEAQVLMMETEIVKRNPHWLEEPRLLSGPGQGAHPRGMAIDVSVQGIDMGTVFDAMVPQSARNYMGFAPEILQNRSILESVFVQSAKELNLPFLPLPSEWWDFRLTRDHSGRYDPLSDEDLPQPLKICTQSGVDAIWDAHFADLAKSLPLSL